MQKRDMDVKDAIQKFLSPERVLALGFLALILLGTVLFTLPASTIDRRGLSVFDALFTATSATCVTGLVAVDTGNTFSAFGQAVLLTLIQVGGLGFMVFATLIMNLLGKKMSLQNRVLLRESMSGSSLSGLGRLTGVYAAIAFGIEVTGALLLSIRMIPRYGVGQGIWFSFFHAISAFCNAGFDLFGNYTSLTVFADDPLVILTVSALVIMGAMGFYVIFDVAKAVRGERLSLQSKVVLMMSGGLLLGGMVLFAILEWTNPATLDREGANIGTKLLDAFFQSVTMRTAGFNSVDLLSLRSSSKLVAAVLMFIGASPASTGGGVKTTTIAVLGAVVFSVVRGRNEVTMMKKTLPVDLARRALAIVIIMLVVLLIATTMLAAFEADRVPFIDLLFESASAIATVGVSAYGTPGLSLASRILIIPMMYLGRVGPMTLALALANCMSRSQNRIRYPEERIMLG